MRLGTDRGQGWEWIRTGVTRHGWGVDTDVTRDGGWRGGGIDQVAVDAD